MCHVLCIRHLFSWGQGLLEPVIGTGLMRREDPPGQPPGSVTPSLTLLLFVQAAAELPAFRVERGRKPKRRTGGCGLPPELHGGCGLPPPPPKYMVSRSISVTRLFKPLGGHRLRLENSHVISD